LILYGVRCCDHMEAAVSLRLEAHHSSRVIFL
jgi:hypothetical protein